MKRPAYILKIENPCNEDWDLMHTSAGGKFCSQCQHQVADFSRLSDNEILQIIEKTQGRLCGRFNQKQLNRLMVQAGDPAHTPALYKILAGLLLLSSAEGISAQQHQPEVAFVSNAGQTDLGNMDAGTPSEIKDVSTGQMIHGQVLNDGNKDPIPLALVRIKDTKITELTGNKGEFTLYIPDSVAIPQIVLQVTCPGYDTASVVVNRIQANIPIIFMTEIHLPAVEIVAPSNTVVNVLEATMGMVSVVRETSSRKKKHKK